MELSDDYKLFLSGAFSAPQNIAGKYIMNPNKSRHTLCTRRIWKADGLVTF